MQTDRDFYRVLVFRRNQIDLHSKWVDRTLRAENLEKAVKLVEAEGGKVMREECSVDEKGRLIIITVQDA